jgi:LPXTG-motif cell wall-anchored protein
VRLHRPDHRGRSTAGTVVADGGVQDAVKAGDRAAFTVKLGAGGKGGDLPVTGAPAGSIALGGVLLLAGGATAFVVARRRRIVTVV